MRPRDPFAVRPLGPLEVIPSNALVASMRRVSEAIAGDVLRPVVIPLAVIGCRHTRAAHVDGLAEDMRCLFCDRRYLGVDLDGSEIWE